MSDFECTKCNKEIIIAEFELWNLYSEEDSKEILCPHCDEKITIRIEREYSFECINEDDL
tara:strand:- start:315 stop:494 length:180 start_codon:yes stop_codon:yes gene_type:complete